MIRVVYPAPAPVVDVYTMFAPNSRSFPLVVVAAPLLLLALLPTAAGVTSTEFTGSIPLYSNMRISGYAAAGENVTVTRFAPGGAAMSFFAELIGCGSPEASVGPP